MAEEADEDYELPKLPQVMFYMMLLNEAERLGVLHERVLRTLESARTELRWSTFESWVWMYGDQIFEARLRTKVALEKHSRAGPLEEGSAGEDSVGIHPSGGSRITGEEGKQGTLDAPIFPFIMAFPSLYDIREMVNYASIEQAAEYIRDHFRWSLRDPSAPGPRPLPLDYQGLCSRFELGEATPFTQAYHRLRDVGHTKATEYVRDNLRWSVRETSSLHPNLLPLHFTAYFPEFDHIVVMQFAHAAYIPEMVQAIFYAMVINDAAKLRLIKRETGKSLMLDLRKLRWDIIEVLLLSIEDKLKDAQVSSPGGDSV
ncbi:hypothetical protein Cgig2_012341 [Carnegiea gigantea]|uniref:Uncharacterized protein n=1 Tax=Carnegiea gigantea TaxID=171969 RepID=A0A9Q1JQN3_9CARY|nr:hypothetical protein Cgig2_012341 [Carnegiea gigantea]